MQKQSFQEYLKKLIMEHISLCIWTQKTETTQKLQGGEECYSIISNAHF